MSLIPHFLTFFLCFLSFLQPTGSTKNTRPNLRKRICSYAYQTAGSSESKKLDEINGGEPETNLKETEAENRRRTYHASAGHYDCSITLCPQDSPLYPPNTRTFYF